MEPAGNGSAARPAACRELSGDSGWVDPRSKEIDAGAEIGSTRVEGAASKHGAPTSTSHSCAGLRARRRQRSTRAQRAST